jgi:hypothetical protein
MSEQDLKFSTSKSKIVLNCDVGCGYRDSEKDFLGKAKK